MHGIKDRVRLEDMSSQILRCVEKLKKPSQEISNSPHVSGRSGTWRVRHEGTHITHGSSHPSPKEVVKYC